MEKIDWNLPEVWGELSRKWWENNGKACGCSLEQIKFAVLRHAGSSATASARGAGYSYTNNTALRQAAYRAQRSTGVMNLLSLATAADGLGEGAITDQEIDSKIAKLISSSDARVSIAAIEAREKLTARRSADGIEPALNPDEVMIEILEIGGPTIAAAILFRMDDTTSGLKSGLESAPLLAPICKAECPGIWRRALEHNPGHTEWLEGLGNGPVLSGEEIIAKLKQAIAGAAQ